MHDQRHLRLNIHTYSDAQHIEDGVYGLKSRARDLAQAGGAQHALGAAALSC